MTKLKDDELLDILRDSKALGDGRFFSDERYSPGITYLLNGESKTVDQPHVALATYEKVLEQIRRVDPIEYAKIHKGTPYYFIGWLSCEMKDYEKGVSYKS